MFLDTFNRGMGFNAGDRPLYQNNRDVDRDGTVDISMLSSVGAGPAGASGYEIELYRSSTSGGTYTLVGSVNSQTGKVWFKGSTEYWYKTRARAYDWTNTHGTWSALTAAVQPTPISGAPTAPSSVTVTPVVNGFIVQFPPCDALDYAHSEIAITGSASPTSDHVVQTTRSSNAYVYYPLPANVRAWVRHVNTSDVATSWTSSSFFGKPIQAVNMNVSLLGSSGGNVTIGDATKTLLSVTFLGASNTTGIDITLGSRTWTNVVFENNVSQTFVTVEDGGGTFSVSKSGGGSWSGVTLSAIGYNIDV